MDRLIALSLLLCSCSLFVPAARDDSGGMVFHYPAAASVQLVGDWNEWGGITGPAGILDPNLGLMESEGGFWRGSPPEDLARGRYRYAFLVNGHELHRDPLNPRTTEFRGSRVSLLIID